MQPPTISRSPSPTPSLPRGGSPFPRYGWCRNPFGELTREERIHLAVIDWETWHDQVGRPMTAIQFVGRCGRGKTTRMLAIAARFPKSHYVYLPEDGPTPAIAAGSPLLIDEAQRLPWRVRRTILTAGVPLVLATHRDLRGPLRRYGYQVHTYPIGETNDAGKIFQVMTKRIEAATIDPKRSPRFCIDDAEWLGQTFGSNLRAIEHFLYNQVQTQVMADGEVRFSNTTG